MLIRALIRSGASAGIVDGEPRDGLRSVFASSDPERLGDGSREDLSPDDFPGRWNRRRAIAPELLPLPRVAADALFDRVAPRFRDRSRWSGPAGEAQTPGK